MCEIINNKGKSNKRHKRVAAANKSVKMHSGWL